MKYDITDPNKLQSREIIYQNIAQYFHIYYLASYLMLEPALIKMSLILPILRVSDHLGTKYYHSLIKAQEM